MTDTTELQGIPVTYDVDTREVVAMDWGKLGVLFRAESVSLKGLGPGSYGDFRVYLRGETP